MIIDNFGISKLLELTSSGRMRNVARLYFVTGMSAKEISIQMGYPESVIVSEIILIKSIVEKQLRAVYCDRCETLFYTSNKNVIICPKCIKENRKLIQKTKENKKETKQPTTKVKKKKPKSIYEILREKEKYNKVNGTNLSYGDYVLLKGE